MTHEPALPPRRELHSLLINVSTLLQEPIGSERAYDIAAAPFTYEGPRRIDGALQLLRTDQSLLARGRLGTAINDICGGCLAPLTLELPLEFEEEFWPPNDALTGRPIDAPPERDGFAVIDGQIDLAEVVRQYVEMARPISPRCAADCPGIDAARADAEPELDERWAALAPLREQLNRP